MHNRAQVIAGVWEVFQGVKRHEEIPNCETLLTSFETFFALFRSRRFCTTCDNYNHLLVAVWQFFFDILEIKFTKVHKILKIQTIPEFQNLQI